MTEWTKRTRRTSAIEPDSLSAQVRGALLLAPGLKKTSTNLVRISAVIDYTSKRFELLAWTGAFLAVLVANLCWRLLNDAPPLWDMAYHQLKGWDFLEAWNQGELPGGLATLSPVYPPLYYMVEAFVLSFTRNPKLLPFFSNIPALFLLSFSTWRLARRFTSGPTAAVAATLTLLLPMSAWIGRESLLDGQLAGLTALGGWLVLRSGFFQDTRWTALFGLICGLGMLTKWTFPFCMAGPVLYALYKTEKKPRAAANLLLGTVVGLSVAAPYYLPNLSDMLARYPTTEQSGLIPWKPYPRHGEPGLNNLWGWIYYPRILLGHYLQLPLAALLAAGVWKTLRGSSGRDGERSAVSAGYLWVWLLSGVALLTFVTPKDPRFALPLAAPLAVLTLLPWSRRPALAAAVMIWASFQFVDASFSLPWGNVKLALNDLKEDPDYQSLQREWILYQNHYSDAAGPPVRQDWALGEILNALPDGARVGFMPDLARFHGTALALEARREGREVPVFKIGNDPRSVEFLDRVDYVVSKTGHQGISFITGYNSAALAEIRSRGWPPAGEWPLPDGSKAQLWMNPQPR